MSNAPNTIYLQTDEFPETTWCVDRINDTDTEYVKAERIAELKMQNKKLVQALAPFAQLASVYQDRGYESYVRVSKHGDMLLKAGDYYRAQELIRDILGAAANAPD